MNIVSSNCALNAESAEISMYSCLRRPCKIIAEMGEECTFAVFVLSPYWTMEKTNAPKMLCSVKVTASVGCIVGVQL